MAPRKPGSATLQPGREPGTVPPERLEPANLMNFFWTDTLPRRRLLRELTASEA